MADLSALQKIYNATEDPVRYLGRKHYADLLESVSSLASEYGHPVVNTVWCFSQLSPLCSVNQNFDLTRKMCGYGEYGNPGTTEKFARKAWAALNGSFHSVTGPKVQHFARAILGDSQAVALDRWMLRALGHIEDSCAGPTYRKYLHQVRQLARKNREYPRDFQAIIWMATREETRVLL